MRVVAEKLNFYYDKKSKNKVRALSDVTLTIPEGSFFGIIGHTGSGKSTFIQHIDALIPVQEGKLVVGDYDLSRGKKTDKKKLKELRSRTGIVFQYPEYQLFAETVFQDVAFGYKNFNKEANDEQVKTAVYGALALVGLGEELANKSPFELSGGQKRRVAIAGVIVSKPEILILDEPVAGLDPVGKRELMSLLHALHEHYVKTIVIVSHDMDEVAENCTDVAVFSEGKVVMTGTPREIFSRADELAALRLDVPVTAKLTAALKRAGVDVNSDFTTDDFVSKVAEIYKKA
ncbi:MAG: energy-coupling factor transporter ATPase [Clostridia bacterium]|nr:energy-coupling factor transporter ATPase [Clostridiales bacterium]MDD7166512.1 energy-coupling factor transporter ATPase [Clostridia bacterium]MDY2900842.1 energy-coupling factor transporter ATPase [Christensenellaceae bacterium]